MTSGDTSMSSMSFQSVASPAGNPTQISEQEVLDAIKGKKCNKCDEILNMNNGTMLRHFTSKHFRWFSNINRNKILSEKRKIIFIFQFVVRKYLENILHPKILETFSNALFVITIIPKNLTEMVKNRDIYAMLEQFIEKFSISSLQKISSYLKMLQKRLLNQLKKLGKSSTQWDLGISIFLSI